MLLSSPGKEAVVLNNHSRSVTTFGSPTADQPTQAQYVLTALPKKHKKTTQKDTQIYKQVNTHQGGSYL